MGALDGYKILDFTTLLPGPYATMTLADLGAEVLKVSGRDKYDLVVNWPPVIEGAQVTGAQAWLGRGKKTIFLNLKNPSAVEAVKKLVMEYDIVVEQFRPGVMAKLGVGYEQLREVNPRGQPAADLLRDHRLRTGWSLCHEGGPRYQLPVQIRHRVGSGQKSGRSRALQFPDRGCGRGVHECRLQHPGRHHIP